MEDVCPCSICRDVRPKSYMVPREHTFCLCCILHWTLRKFTCPLCRSVMSAIHFSVQADGSLPCSITLPSEYEAESHQRASLWGTATSQPAPSGSPAHPTEEELPGSSHTAPGDLCAHPTTPIPRETEDDGQLEQKAAAGPSAQDCSHGPTTADQGRERSARGSHCPRKRRARSTRDTSQPYKRLPPRHH